VTATGCSITSTATVSTAATTGCLIRRAAFFTGARFGLALITVRFVAFTALDILRALPRLAELRSFAGFCTFDAFLRLAMISPCCARAMIDAGSDGNRPSPSNPSNGLSTGIFSGSGRESHFLGLKIPLFFFGRTGASFFLERKAGTKVKLPHHFTSRFDNPTDAVQEHGTWGDEGKAPWRGSAGGFAV
jgi:hypothetical protein